MLKNKEIALVLNTTEGAIAMEDSFSIRRTALTSKVPYFTTIAGARGAVDAIRMMQRGAWEVKPIQEYHKDLNLGKL